MERERVHSPDDERGHLGQERGARGITIGRRNEQQDTADRDERECRHGDA